VKTRDEKNQLLALVLGALPAATALLILLLGLLTRWKPSFDAVSNILGILVVFCAFCIFSCTLILICYKEALFSRKGVWKLVTILLFLLVNGALAVCLLYWLALAGMH